MCEPVTISILAATAVASATTGGGAALAIAGIGMGIAGAVHTAISQQKAGKYQQEVADNNAKIAKMQAGSRLEQAQEQKRTRGFQAAAERAAGQTAFAACGVRLGSGSVLDWDADVQQTAQLDYDSIDYNAALDVWGLKNQAAQFKSDGELAKMQGTNAAIGTTLQGGGGLLTQGALTAKTFS